MGKDHRHNSKRNYGDYSDDRNDRRKEFLDTYNKVRKPAVRPTQIIGDKRKKKIDKDIGNLYKGEDFGDMDDFDD